ncbi:hypothetical protein CK203_009087 [Vitis vinifera]|uniref:Uncharacterized protein n=1 Tax=Vitis vinifera TaxID=29760 RepID=A0A438K395_VITVI|nr:hypothetical protein CK203_009087 [Vitis vinifera]
MSAKKDVVSSSAVRQSGKDESGEVHAKKSLDKLNVREFCERFCIPNDLSVQLVDEEAVSTDKSADNAIYFTKEQFNVGLRFPLPSLFKEFLHFTHIPPAYIHPNMVRVLMGCSILSMLFNLDLSLLEVLFIYSIKKGKNDFFSLAARLPSLQLVTDLPDSTKEGAKGHVSVRGVWAGLLEHPERPFSPNRSLVFPGKAACGVCPAFVCCSSYFGIIRWLTSLVADNAGTDKRGRVVEWVEKTSFDHLNKLFEITAAERHHQTLLTARNLLVVVREPQVYVTNILPGKLPKKVVSGKHFVLKDLPFYTEVRKADAQARRVLLNEWEERRQEGTLRRAPGDKRSAPFPPAGAPAGKEEEGFHKGNSNKISSSHKGNSNKISSSLRLALYFKRFRAYPWSKRIGAFNASG